VKLIRQIIIVPPCRAVQAAPPSKVLGRLPCTVGGGVSLSISPLCMFPICFPAKPECNNMIKSKSSAEVVGTGAWEVELLRYFLVLVFCQTLLWSQKL